MGSQNSDIYRADQSEEVDFRLLKVEMIDDSKLKIDYDTTLESFFKTFAFLMLITGAIFLFGFFKETDPMRKPPIWFSIVPLIPAALSYLLYKLTDNYYIVDFSQKKLMYRFKFLFYETVFPKGDLQDIIFIATEAMPKHERSGYWYEYAVYAIIRNGRKIRLSKWLADRRGDIFDKIESEMIHLSELIEIPCMPDGRVSRIKLKKNDRGEFEAEYEKIIPGRDSTSIVLVIALGVFILFIIIMLIYLVMMQK